MRGARAGVSAISDVAMRVDASTAAGTGHVMRCLALADAMRARQAHVRFICRDHPGNLADEVARWGFAVSLLPPPVASGEEEGTASWLGATEIDDADQTIAALAGYRPDWLVVDHYSIGTQWERRLEDHAARLLAIDDLADREHACDILLDQNHARDAAGRYRGLVPANCRLLLGTRYALLRSEFAAAAAAATGSRRARAVARVFVFFGGSDPGNMSGRTLAALSHPDFSDLEVDVVLGVNQAHRASVERQAAARPRTRLHGPGPEFARLMAGADLAIGAGGTTTWERLCLGMPSLVVAIAANQVPACEALQAEGLIDYLGTQDQVGADDIRAALRECLENRERLEQQSLRGRVRVDGFGAARVVEHMMPSGTASLRLRPASSTDAFLYFGWANDPEARAQSLQTAPIRLEEHLAWFASRLESRDSHLYVLESGRLPVGQIRFDRGPEGFDVSYSLDADVRGRGWAKRLVKLGLNAMSAYGSAEIRATVKAGNAASDAVFRGLGFEEVAAPATADRRKFRLHNSAAGSRRHAD